MKQKRSLRYILLVAYLKKQSEYKPVDVWAINHIRSRYVWMLKS